MQAVPAIPVRRPTPRPGSQTTSSAGSRPRAASQAEALRSGAVSRAWHSQPTAAVTASRTRSGPSVRLRPLGRAPGARAGGPRVLDAEGGTTEREDPFVEPPEGLSVLDASGSGRTGVVSGGTEGMGRAGTPPR